MTSPRKLEDRAVATPGWESRPEERPRKKRNERNRNETEEGSSRRNSRSVNLHRQHNREHGLTVVAGAAHRFERYGLLAVRCLEEDDLVE